jgi:hypothetical protein
MTATFAFNDVLSTAAGLTTCYQLTVKDVGGGQVWNECYILSGTAANINLIPPAGRSGCTGIPLTVTSGTGTLTGSGSAGVVALWTGPTALGNSGLSDAGTGLTYIGNSLSFDGLDSVNAGATTIQVIDTAGTGALEFIAGGGSGGGNNITSNGAYIFAGGGKPHVLYFPSTVFVSLGTPNATLVGHGGDGAMIYCYDAKGPQNSATWGSAASASGTGALLRYCTASAGWLVIG